MRPTRKKTLLVFPVLIAVILIFTSLSCFASLADETGPVELDPSNAALIDKYDPYKAEAEAADSFGVSGTMLAMIIAVIVAGAAVAFVLLRSKKKKEFLPAPRQPKQKDRSTPLSELEPIKRYRRLDPDFDVSDFEEQVKKLFIDLQDCRVKGDVSALRPLLSHDLYSFFESQIAKYKAEYRVLHIDQLRISHFSISGFKRRKIHDHIKVIIEAKMIEYLESTRSQRTVSGSRHNEKTKKYEWDLKRPISVANGEDLGNLPDYAKNWRLNSIKSLSESVAEKRKRPSKTDKTNEKAGS